MVMALMVVRRYRMRGAMIALRTVAGMVFCANRGMMAKAKLKAIPFQSAAEALGEKFHASPKLLAALNPGIRLDVAGLLLSTAAAVLAGREVLRLVPGSAASAGGLLALVLSFVAGFVAAALVQLLFSRAARRMSQA